MMIQIISHALKGFWKRETSEIPAACYDVCNDAFMEGQAEGKTAKLCESDSPFMKALQNCSTCVDGSSLEGFNGTLQNQFSEFSIWLRYCNTTLTKSSEQSRVQSLLAKESDLLASAQALGSQIASLGINSSLAIATATATGTQSSTFLTTTSGSQGLVTVYATQTASGSGNSAGSKSHSNATTIAPAVVVPVVAVAIIAVLGFFFVRRRRLRKVKDSNLNTQPPMDDKPQLHADEFRPELEGSDRGVARSVLGQKVPRRITCKGRGGS
ncbi:hypothetical protein N7509_004135 [Penicillium cosmopolitanum]|uniref:Uncharacterized protein n=1 Tax=Penicillium cosmopolitanum TaxID=1131564 RepID=A0A9X0BC48_9EURO|nr:uncharacterized protein N7509_004135 [Penicillium cosmopolitanum]KAJ5404264.1 hypothetical protein N7509_004135 [Penicillium cosmopolitanum]